MPSHVVEYVKKEIKKGLGHNVYKNKQNYSSTY